MKRVFAVVIVLAVVIGGGLWWHALDGSDRTPGPDPAKVAPTSPTSSPTSSPGHRWVGRGRIVVEVPANWTTNETQCGTALADTVAFYSTTQRACLVADQGFSIVTIAPFRLELVDSMNPGGSGFFVQEWASKADDALISVRTRDKAVFDRIVKSYRRLGPEWTTVPDVSIGNSSGVPGVDATPTGSEIARRLQRFDLKAEIAILDLKSPTGAPNRSDPAAGTVVRRGSIVIVTTGL